MAQTFTEDKTVTGDSGASELLKKGAAEYL
jgi:hypothetical protein